MHCVDCLQVLTVHSLYRVENQSTVAMHFRMTIIAEQQERLLGRGHRYTPGFQVPGTGMLEPGEHCYLPVPASLGALVYLKAAGYQRAEKDVIRIDENLRKQEGLYTCPHRWGLCAI